MLFVNQMSCILYQPEHYTQEISIVPLSRRWTKKKTIIYINIQHKFDIEVIIYHILVLKKYH